MGEARRCGLTLKDTALLLRVRAARGGKRDLATSVRRRLEAIDAHLVRLRRSRDILRGAARIHGSAADGRRAVLLDRLVGAGAGPSPAETGTRGLRRG